MTADRFQAAAALFLRVRDLEQPAREAALAQACGDDAALRADVDDLLRGAAAEEPFARLADDLRDVNRQLRERPAARGGEHIGPYRLLERIGEGGFGTVHMAEQQSPVRRMVALKVLKAGMDSRRVIARFEAERQALALMDHPNITRVLDAGETEQGRPFFVMELVRGVPITDYCNRNKLSPRERLELMVPVCQAVQHAHQKGIIHRDIKPSNVLVTLHDGVPVPKVIDFGIAKAIHGKLTDKTLFTEFRQFVGTPEYMSPEQAEMSGLDVDTRADIYSLGVLLYELLTGTTPFDSADLREAPVGEVQRLIREVEPPRPSRRISTLASSGIETGPGSAIDIARQRRIDVRGLGRLLRGELDWIVMKCLEKDRTRRYESASTLARDLVHYLADEPVLAGPPTAAYRLAKLARRHRGLLAAAVAVVLSLAAGLTVAAFGFMEASRERDVARRQADAARRGELREREARSSAQAAMVEAETQARLARENAERASREMHKAGSLLSLLRRLVLGAANSRVARGGDYTVRQLVDDFCRAHPDSIGSDPDVEAALRLTMGTVYQNLGEHEVARRQLEQALALRRQQNDAGATAECLDVLALAQVSLGEMESSLRSAREALALREAARIDPVASLLVLARVCLFDGRLAEAVAVAERALAIVRGSPDPSPGRVVDLLQTMADAWHMRGDFQRAHELLREALAVAIAGHGDADATTLDVEADLAILRIETGDYAAAEQSLRSVLRHRRGLWPADHPTVLATAVGLADALLEAGRYGEAVALGRETLARCRARWGEDHPRVAECAVVLGQAANWSGDHDGGRELLQRAVAAYRATYGPGHLELGRPLHALAGVLLDCDDLAAAESAAREACAILERKCGASHPWSARALARLGAIVAASHRPAEARACLDDALVRQRSALGSSHPDLAATLEARAILLAESGDPDAAERDLRECLGIRIARLPEGHWLRPHTAVALAAVLLDRDRAAEAEDLLGPAAAELERNGDVCSGYKRVDLERIVNAYERRGLAETANAWRARGG